MTKKGPVDTRQTAAQGVFDAVHEALRAAGGPAVGDAFDMLAEVHGNRFHHAATIIRGEKLGRPPIDDDDALRRIAELAPSRPREAVGSVANHMAGGDKKLAKATASRLRKKWRAIQNETDEKVTSMGSTT